MFAFLLFCKGARNLYFARQVEAIAVFKLRSMRPFFTSCGYVLKYIPSLKLCNNLLSKRLFELKPGSVLPRLTG